MAMDEARFGAYIRYIYIKWIPTGSMQEDGVTTLAIGQKFKFLSSAVKPLQQSGSAANTGYTGDGGRGICNFIMVHAGGVGAVLGIRPSCRIRAAGMARPHIQAHRHQYTNTMRSLGRPSRTESASGFY